jgi:hypothetical protein
MKKSDTKRTIPFWICLIASIGLLITGFFMPPIGQIDNSVITSVGLLFGFGVLAQLPILIEVAGYAKIQKGDTTIEFSKENEDDK